MSSFTRCLSLIWLLNFTLWLVSANAQVRSLQPKKLVPSSSKPVAIPMQAAYWSFDSSKVEFITHRGVGAVRGKKNAYYKLLLKDQTFTDGTIEFDVELVGNGFPGITFRLTPDGKHGENVYLRAFGPVTPLERSTLQYAPIVDTTSMWNLYDEYQSGAVIHQQGWNHIKLVIAGQHMKVYVNDNRTARLHIPQLDASTTSGGIALTGNVIYANLTIDSTRPAGLSTDSAYNPVAADTRYLRHWQVSDAVKMPFGKDPVFLLPSMYGMLTRSDLPDSTAHWQTVEADHRAMVNLSTRYGGVKNDGRRLAWLKTTLKSDQAQEKLLQLGFSDEVWVFVNGQIVHVDKNYFGTPNAKADGRCTLENATIRLPLKAGKNQVLIGLANYFYGWGLIARLADTAGISFAL